MTQVAVVNLGEAMRIALDSLRVPVKNKYQAKYRKKMSAVPGWREEENRKRRARTLRAKNGGKQ